MKVLYNEKEVSILNLGEVRIGESKTYNYTLENDSVWNVRDIELSLVDIDGKPVTEITFTESPTTMKGNTRSTLQFSWTPSIEIKRGLKTTLQIKAIEIWD